LKHKYALSDNYDRYFIALIEALVQKSHNKEMLRDIITSEVARISKKHERLQEALKQHECGEPIEIDKTLISIDERFSAEKLTPYHLSYFIQFFAEKKSLGQFFTPAIISEYLVDQSLSYIKTHADNSIHQLAFADIACGTGNIIVSIIGKILNKHFLPKFNTREASAALVKFIENNIVGIDIDPLALFIAKLRILLLSDHFFPQGSLPNLSNNFLEGSVLIDRDVNTLRHLPIYKKLQIDRRFDIILTNPPFMVYGLRNGQEYPQEFKSFLRSRYSTAEYKLPLYPLFIERALELLNEGGILGIITPDSYLLGRYYSKLRKYLLEQTSIKEVTILTFEPFFRATIGRTLLSFFQKDSSKKTFTDIRTVAKRITNLEEVGKNKGYRTTINVSGKYKRFIVFFDEKEKKIVEKWKEVSNTVLADICAIHTGIRSKIGQKKIISRKKHGPNWKKGIISGKEIEPFNINWSGHYININEKLLWRGGFDPMIIEKEKILLRQTGYKVICAVDNKGFYHLNNTHSITLVNDKIDIYALAVILNSVEFNKVYQILTHEFGRVFAQIDMDFLLEMPIPVPNKEIQDTLHYLYWQLTKKREKNINLLNYVF